jgi:replicative DNA helicase
MHYSEEAEKTVLSYLLWDVKFTNIAQQILRESFFYYKNLKRMYAAIDRVYKRWHTTMSYDMFEKILNKNQEMTEGEKTGFLVLFQELSAMTLDDTRFNYWLDSLADLKMKRDAANLIDRYKDQVETMDGKEILEGMNLDLHSIRIDSNLLVINKGFVFDNVEERFRDYEQTKLHGEVPGIPYGWTKLDKQTGGHFPGEVGLVFSRMGVGKTRILNTWAYNAAHQGFNTMFITIEMSHKEIARMSDSRVCELYYEKLKKAKLTPEEEEKWKYILQMMSQSQNRGIYLVDMPRGCTTSSVEEEINQYERTIGKLDCVVIDYLMLMDSLDSSARREDKYGDIVKELKQIARLKNVSILTGMQASRKATEVEDPLQVGLEHVALSDQIPAHINMGIYVFRTADDKLNNQIQVNMLKSRDSAQEHFPLYTDWNYSYIGDTLPKKQSMNL